MARDWIEWHRAYDDPASPLSQRLDAVVGIIRSALDAAPPGEIRVLSLCAGDARDISTAALDHQRARDLSGCVVELDPDLAARATANAAAAGTALAVRAADAGASDVWRDVLPVDLLLLTGIFGNIDDDNIQATIAAVPAMCRAGATVIWTRHRRPPDLTPQIQTWFTAAGCPSTDFLSPGATAFAVGAQRCDAPVTAPLPARLFTFRDDLW